ncbi:MAG TPA: PBP1A family penicillin-binding protein [Candidatus Krumholzibacteria bacterium]|nr:PBP1A family penicillin-binding protein [Candidatus Krumholzibacteria bacterium]
MTEPDAKRRRGLLSRRLSPFAVKFAFWGLVAVVLLGGGGVLAVVHQLSRDLPSPARLQTIEPAIKTLVFSADGDTLREFYRQNRVPVRLDEIPPLLVQAVIATEDRDFYDHYGITIRGFARAAVTNLRERRAAQGGSTLTMQLARSLFLHHRKEWTRKVREILLALQIERTYTKDEILEMYLNTIYFGPAYGVEAASLSFFGKSVRDVTPAEATLLAGVLNNPGYYSPYRNLDRAYERRAIVLRNLVRAGHLDPDTAAEVGSTEVEIRRDRDDDRLAPYFVEEVRQYLEEHYGVKKLYEDGLRVHTTLDAELQHKAEAHLEGHLVKLEEQEEYEQTRALYDSLYADVEPEERPLPEYLQGGLLFMDVRTGSVRAMVGGRDFRVSKFNRATQAQRQPGSVFKPFLYAAALERGWTPASILLDAPVEVNTGSDELWRPVNFEGEFNGPVTLRHALAHSINVPAVRLILELGTQPVIEMAGRVGLDRDGLPDVYSLALGAGEATLIDLVSAYSAFANHGIRTAPLFIERIENARGEVLEQNLPYQEEAIDEVTNFLVVDLMRTALKEGTGRSARAYDFHRDGAGKTGTTDGYSDAWFVGFTPDVVGGVWVGFDQQMSMGRRKTGAVMALPIWARTMVDAVENTPETTFRRPEGIVERLVCRDSGQLPTSACVDIEAEIFAETAPPSRSCEIHQRGSPALREEIGDFEAIDAQSARRDEFDTGTNGGGGG